jgi:hypothetical protein
LRARLTVSCFCGPPAPTGRARSPASVAAARPGRTALPPAAKGSMNRFSAGIITTGRGGRVPSATHRSPPRRADADSIAALMQSVRYERQIH